MGTANSCVRELLLNPFQRRPGWPTSLSPGATAPRRCLRTWGFPRPLSSSLRSRTPTPLRCTSRRSGGLRLLGRLRPPSPSTAGRIGAAARRDPEPVGCVRSAVPLPGARQRRRPCRPDRMRARPRTRTPTRAPRSGATATLSGGRHTQGPHPQIPARAPGLPMLTGARPEPVLRRAGGLCHPVRFQNAEAA